MTSPPPHSNDHCEVLRVIELPDHSVDDTRFVCCVCVEYHGLQQRRNIPQLLTAEEEEEIRWYIEDFTRDDPFEHTRSRKTAQLLASYAERLAVELDLERLLARRRARLVLLEVVDSGCPESTFHKIHWELLEQHTLWPDKLSGLSITVVRAVVVDSKVQFDSAAGKDSGRGSENRNVLLVVARSLSSNEPPHRDITLQVLQSNQQENPQNNGKPSVDIVRPCTFEALQLYLEKGKFDIVHFDMHGVEKEGRVFLRFFKAHAQTGTIVSDDVPAHDVADVLVKHGVRFVILNACRSGKETGGEPSIARAFVQRGITAAGAMAYNVLDSATRIFCMAFYRAFFLLDCNVTTAFGAARLCLGVLSERVSNFGTMVPLHDCAVPRIYVKNSSEQRMLVEALETKHGRRIEPDDAPTLIGRDIDIFRLETNMLLRGDRNVALVTGVHGIGKSALLKHLASWWKSTMLVEHALVIDMKDIRDSDIVRHISANLGSGVDPENLYDYLANHRCLIVFDSAEACNGEQIRACRSILQKKITMEREPGVLWMTMLIVASRYDDRLDEYGFEHELQGIPEIAALQLASQLIQENGAAIETAEDLQYLKGVVRLVDRNPLVIYLLMYDMCVKRLKPKPYFADLLRAEYIHLDQTWVDSTAGPRSVVELKAIIEDIGDAELDVYNVFSALLVFAFWKLVPVSDLLDFGGLVYLCIRQVIGELLGECDIHFMLKVLTTAFMREKLSQVFRNHKISIKPFEQGGFLTQVDRTTRKGLKNIKHLKVHPLLPVILRTHRKIYESGVHDAVKLALPRFYTSLLSQAASWNATDIAKRVELDFINHLAAAFCLLKEAPDGYLACAGLWQLFRLLHLGVNADPGNHFLIEDAEDEAFPKLISRLSSVQHEPFNPEPEYNFLKVLDPDFCPFPSAGHLLQQRDIAIAYILVEIASRRLMASTMIFGIGTGLDAEKESLYLATYRQLCPLTNPQSILCQEDAQSWNNSRTLAIAVADSLLSSHRTYTKELEDVARVLQSRGATGATTHVQSAAFLPQLNISRAVQSGQYDVAHSQVTASLKDLIKSAADDPSGQAAMLLQLCKVSVLKEDWTAADHYIQSATKLEPDVAESRRIEIEGWRLRVLEQLHPSNSALTLEGADKLYNLIEDEDVPSDVECQVTRALAALKLSRQRSGPYSSIFLLIRGAKAYYRQPAEASCADAGNYINAIISDISETESFWLQSRHPDDLVWQMYRIVVYKVLGFPDTAFPIGSDGDKRAAFRELEVRFFAPPGYFLGESLFPGRDWVTERQELEQLYAKGCDIGLHGRVDCRRAEKRLLDHCIVL